MSLKRLSPTLLLLAVSLAARAETIEWKGIKWDVKQGPNMGPGPNLWSAANVSGHERQPPPQNRPRCLRLDLRRDRQRQPDGVRDLSVAGRGTDRQARQER